MTTEKYVVFSDVHGRSDLVHTLLSKNRDAEAYFFLGDGLRDLPEGEPRLFSVRGNCDFSLDPSTPEEYILNLGGRKILLMHGHRHSVKSGLDRAIRYASERGADALLFGHTHLPLENYYSEGSEFYDGYRLPRDLWVFNPGSLAEGSFGLLQIRGGQMLFSHGTV
ncbi:MAG: metallophosphoesterase family protein [Clostridia bacterium]|nr:metallophosphoesterase family protein [Clostridia bacterium]